MPFFTLPRTHTLSTTKGHIVNFKKGEKTWVPMAIVSDALAIGAVPEDPKDGDVLPPDQDPTQQDTPEQLKAKAFAAFEKLFLRSHRGDFMASGHPHPLRLKDLMGYEIPQKLRDALWMEYNAKKSEEANQ